MKKIIILLIIISIKAFSCVGFIPKNTYFIMDNKVYYKPMRSEAIEIKNADSETFEIISVSTQSCEYRDYGKDKNHVYFRNNIVNGAIPESFVMLEKGYYKDNKYLYFYGQEVLGSDSTKSITFINKKNSIEWRDCLSWGDNNSCILNNNYIFKDGRMIPLR